MFATIRNAWKIADLRKKILFTLLVLLIFRLGSAIAVPYVNVEVMGEQFGLIMNGSILDLYNTMSGSAFSTAKVFALGIQPYINASIIIQLLCVAIPYLERLQKEGGEEGKKKLERISRFTTLGLSLLMGWAYYMMIQNLERQAGTDLLTDHGVLPAIVIILTFTAGSCFVMWLGEQIDKAGIGNGISMILFAGIIARVPDMVVGIWNEAAAGNWWILLTILGVIALVVVVVFITNSERRIPVQYAKHVVGRKQYGGQNSFLPIKVNMSGVLPVIFAQSIASLPTTVMAFIYGNEAPTNTFWAWVNNHVFSQQSVIYCVIYFLLIIAFSYFYSAIQFNPIEIANNMKKNNGSIPGFRPGKPTADFIAKVINKVTLFGAIYLAFVALLPVAIGAIVNNPSLAIGGTSVIIVVGVALETVKALEAQMLMRHYKGFLQ